MTGPERRRELRQPSPSFPGRTRISRAALGGAARGAAAERFGVEASRVHVDLEDGGRGLALSFRSPLAVGEDDTDRVAGLHADRAAIAERVGAITGASVTSVAVRITAIEAATTRRVR